jgi:dTDP-4-dehydrorhamnose 3,5-epimerase
MMRFVPTELAGAYLIEPEPLNDERGFFARTVCAREFAAHGIVTEFVQSSISLSLHRGTLRGLHFQVPPACEAKLVRCTTGAVHDVIVDLRPESPTYRRHVAVELTARNRHALYVPKMFAHGLQTLEDNTEVLYEISAFYSPGQSTGLRFDDPKLNIRWPLPVSSISERDRNWPFLTDDGAPPRLHDPTTRTPIGN